MNEDKTGQATPKVPLIIDTDPGDDDAASIMWVLASGMADLKALTIVHGNVSIDKCVINALRTLEVCGRTDIPVFKGAWKPMILSSQDASWIHGKDGLGDAGFPLPETKVATGYASVEMVRIVKESAEKVTILALAPLTNVALAVLLDQEFKERVKEIIFMGGAVNVPGNVNPNASFNVATDPYAAYIVYHSGIPIIQIGLDVCDQVTQDWEDMDTIERSGTKGAEFLIRMLEYRRHKAVKIITNKTGQEVGRIRAEDQAGRGKSGVGLNDLTATGYFINPLWFQTRDVTMDIELQGLTPGRTAADFMGLWGREPNCRFAYGVDARSLVDAWVSDISRMDT
jgi:inosine-uridine nucleoside N-ribohydrolase